MAWQKACQTKAKGGENGGKNEGKNENMRFKNPVFFHVEKWANG